MAPEIGEQKSVIHSGRNETEINFVLARKDDRRYLRDVKGDPRGITAKIHGHKCGEGEIKKAYKKERIIRVRLWKLKENEMRVSFVKRVDELINAKTPDLWRSLQGWCFKGVR